ncbi:KCTD12 [Symbiodinium necroappetens]|uniref:KCTD12 protein n=1 Tax=Symbiodinium necroappetens TaxID=1628268 RepID=A0A812T697_9DINO|nr:KCTD12 [Symbiodinium necroappetens]
MHRSMSSVAAVTRALCFWLLAILARASGPLDLWVLWTDRDGADFFFTSSTCATVTLPDVSIAGNEPAPPPANGGISDMLFFADTFEFVFLEGGKLVRAWMDKTGRSELGFLPGDAAGPVWNATGTGPNLGEEGALAWTQDAGMAMVFFASSLTNKLWFSNLSSVPPRDSSHLGPWMEVLSQGSQGSQATSARPQVPVLLARDGMVLWSDNLVLRTWRAVDALETAAVGGQSGSAVAQLGVGADAWGELLVAEATHDGGLLWIRQVGSSPPQLEYVLQLESLIDGPNANAASGNVRLLHEFSEGDVPSAMAVYFSILGPAMQARLDHLDLGTGVVRTVAFAGGIERRGADPARPGALSIYPMPEVCVNVGCLYLESAFSHCEKCTSTVCDTCFLDTQDWLIKEWYPQHTIWTSCVWLWPIDQALALDESRLGGPDAGAAGEGRSKRTDTERSCHQHQVNQRRQGPQRGSLDDYSDKSNGDHTHDDNNQQFSDGHYDQSVCSRDALDTCRAQIASWCQAEPGVPDMRGSEMVELQLCTVSAMTLAPPDLRAQCAGFAWSAEALCSEPAAVGDGDGTLIGDGAAFDGCTACTELWGLALLAGLGLLLTVMVCITWCLTTSRRLQAQRADQDLRAAAQVRRAGSADEGLNADMGISAPDSTAPDWPASRQPSWKSCSRRLRCPCCRSHASKATSQVKPSPPRPSSREFEEEDRPESAMSSTGAVPGADNIQASVPVEQILKGTWQPELSSAGAAAAAGRLSEAMRKFMSPDSDEAKRWRFLDDVEDILRTLGSALPAGVRNAAWAWHSRQSARLHRSHALTAALDEARSMADDFREDLSERLASGVRRLEASALLEAVGGAGKEGQGDERAPLSVAERESLAKASKVEDALEQLKTRMESLSGSSTGVKGDLLHAGHLLDCQQALQRLLEEQESAERLLREQAGDGDALLPGGAAEQMWQQLGQDIRALQEARLLHVARLPVQTIVLEDVRASSRSAASNPKCLGFQLSLMGSRWLDPSSRRDGRDPKCALVQAASKSWLQGLKQAAARAAGFAAALRTARMQKDKKQLDEMQSLLQKELQSFAEAERVAREGGRWTGQQSDAWRQLDGVWSELKEELKALPKNARPVITWLLRTTKRRSGSICRPLVVDVDAIGFSCNEMRGAEQLVECRMLPPKRSDTRSLDAEELAAAGPAAQASSSQLNTLRAELEVRCLQEKLGDQKLRDKVQQLPNGTGHGKDPESPEERLLMAGLMELHRQAEQKGLANLADSAGGGDGARIQQTLGNLWQQLKGELEILGPEPQSWSSMSSPGTALEGSEDRQLLAEATAALQEHLDFEEKHVQQKRQQLEEELDEKIPAKFAKGEKERDCRNPSPSDTIKLNVGGDTSFTTRRDTLTAIPGSRLALLFSGRWDRSLRRDENGRVFVDVDPVQFRALLAWLVDLKRIEPDAPSPSPPVDSLPRHCRAGFLSLCSYLCCRDVCITQKHISEVKSDESLRSVSRSPNELRESTLVSCDHAKQLNAWLKEASRVAVEPSLKLLFHASRDGFSMQGCHQKCDGHGPTVVVARSAGGHLFGGYAETAWDCSNTYKACQESFLFRLAGPGRIQPSKHRIFQSHQHGIHCHADGLRFGGGHDMQIYAEGAAGKVQFNIGHTYNKTSPQGTFTHLAESQQAVVTDFEVFQVCEHVDLRAAAQSLRSHAELLKSQLEQSEQDLLEKALTVCTAALNQGSGLLAARDSLSSWCDALDEEAQFLSQFMGTSAEIVRLNVGGQLLETLHSTVTFVSDSTLASKFAENWTLQDEEVVEGGIFCDEDPDLFQVVLLHLRLGSPWQRLLKYLNLQAAIKECWDSELLSDEGDQLLSMLQEAGPSPDRQVTLKLLFRASRDGFNMQGCHQKCDAQGPTVVVARSAGGHLFGGYTETAWDSSNTYKACQESFLFRLAGPGNIQPSKHRIFQNHQNGIHCNATHLRFGGGADMQIYAEGAAGKVHFNNLGHTYNPTSSQGTFTYLAEGQQAVVTDFEVFAVVRE